MELRRFDLTCVVAVLTAIVARGAANGAAVLPPTATHLSATSPGFVSYTFSLDLLPGDVLESITFIVNADDMDMQQLHPSGMLTFTNDLNAAIEADPAFGDKTGADDSQFNFSANDWDGLESFNFDTPSQFNATVSDPDVQPADGFEFVHIVFPAESTGTYTYVLSLQPGSPSGGIAFGSDIPFGPTPIPEGSQVLAGSALTMGVLGLYIVRRRWTKRAVTV